MQTVSLKVPAKLDKRLATTSRRHGISKSEYIRRAVQSALEVDAADRAEPPTLLDRAGDLVGCVQFGPADLTTNPEHMRGYGEGA